ncbi:MAG: hypothetical protein P4N60_19110 [Verrucomicrobiae bacterium]|nr:hypothetical protein [Verrucomicrobiae bacterium]
MIFDTLSYVDGSNTVQEVALSLANVAGVPANNKTRFTPRSHAPSEFQISWTQPPETALAIPFKSRCIVYAGRTSSAGAPNTFSSGTILFQGRRWDNEGSASASHVNTTITLLDAWKDLEKVTYAIPWNYISGGTTSAPTYSTFPFTDVVLFQAAPAITYNPAAVNGTITTWQQIQDIIRYAAAYAAGADAVQLQLANTGTLTGTVWSAGAGAEFTPVYLNWYPIKSAKCAECLTTCLRPHPGVFTEIDYTTTPPTLHFRNRAALTAVTLPYAGTDGAGIIHEATEIKSLDELVPDKVRLFYKINGTYNGQPVTGFSTDYYPTNTNSLLALDFSIDITGAATSLTLYNFTSIAFDPTSKALWRKKVPALKQVSEGGQIPNDASTGALAILDTTINGSLASHPDGLQVTDEANAAINLSTYKYYTDQNVYGWMNLGGGAAAVVSANVKGYFSYYKNTGGPLNLTPQIGRHEHSMRLKLTTAPSGLYWQRQILNPGESVPAGLAQAIYTELSVLQWKLKHDIWQVAADATSIPTLIKPGKHKVNLSGGLTAWTTMNAVPENVSIELFRVWVNKNDGTGSEWRLAAKSTINCGPVNHLEPGYLVQLQNLFWNRNRSGIDAYQRLTGTTSSTTVDLSADPARENSVPGTADHAQQIVYAADASDGTRSQVITHDATTGQIRVDQVKTSDGSNYTTGRIMPSYSAAGPPSSGTLATNAFYRTYSTYIDTSVNQMYLCTASGDKTSSVWAAIGGGGAQQFKVQSDGGDYWNCKTWDGTTLGGSIVKVAKPFKLRAGAGAIGSETIRGVTYTYTYTAVVVSGTTVEYTRTASGSDESTETDYVTPAVLVNAIIIGIGFSTATPSTLVGVNYIQIGAEAWGE